MILLSGAPWTQLGSQREVGVDAYLSEGVGEDGPGVCCETDV